METEKAKVTYNGKIASLSPGLINVGTICKELSVNLENESLYLVKKNGINIPLIDNDHIIIRGSEEFISEKKKVGSDSNPILKVPIEIELNGNKVEQSFDHTKIASNDICDLDLEIEAPLLFAEYDNQLDIHISENLNIVIQQGDKFITIPKVADSTVAIDIQACCQKERRPPKGQSKYLIKLDGESCEINKHLATGEEILSLAKKTFEEWSLNQKLFGGRRIPIERDETVDLTKRGIERFETVLKQAQQGG